MGIEFIRKRAKAYEKRWDNGRVDMGTPDLFTRQAACSTLATIATLADGAMVNKGDCVTVQNTPSGPVILVGLTEIARLPNPSPGLMHALDAGHGVAPATIGDVHPISRAADVRICG